MGPRFSAKNPEPNVSLASTKPTSGLKQNPLNVTPQISMGEISFTPEPVPASGGPWLSLGFTLMADA